MFLLLLGARRASTCCSATCARRSSSLLSVLVIIAITIVPGAQDRARARSAARPVEPARARVRDGERRRIPGREVVRRRPARRRAKATASPADARLLDAVDLRVDESLLTGESVPVDKRAAAATPVPRRRTRRRLRGHAGGERPRPRARSPRPGARTEIGRDRRSRSAALGARVRPRCRRETAAARARVLGLSPSCCASLLAGFYVLARGDCARRRCSPASRSRWRSCRRSFRSCSRCSSRSARGALSRANVLTRRMRAIETLGAATVLCVRQDRDADENRMTVRRLCGRARRVRRPGRARPAPLPDAFARGRAHQRDGERTESVRPDGARVPRTRTAVRSADRGRDRAALSDGGTDLLVVTHVWRADGPPVGDRRGEGRAGEHRRAVRAAAGRRCARAATKPARWRGAACACWGSPRGERADGPCCRPTRAHSRSGSSGWSASPIRCGRRCTPPMRECREAGIRVVMITGDYPETARAIARDAGLADVPRVLTGRELDALSDAELRGAPAGRRRLRPRGAGTEAADRRRAQGPRRDRRDDRRRRERRARAQGGAHRHRHGRPRHRRRARGRRARAARRRLRLHRRRPSARVGASSTTSARRCRTWCRCTSRSPASGWCR